MPLRDHITHDKLRELYCWWFDALGSDPVALGRVGPPELRPWLPSIFIMDVLPDRDFRYRLTGTAIDRHLGRNLTGITLSQARSGSTLALLRELFSTVAEQERAGYARSRLEDESRAHITYQRLALPMRMAPDAPVTRILGAWYADFDPDTPPGQRSIHFDPERDIRETVAVVSYG